MQKKFLVAPLTALAMAASPMLATVSTGQVVAVAVPAVVATATALAPTEAHAGLVLSEDPLPTTKVVYEPWWAALLRLMR